MELQSTEKSQSTRIQANDASETAQIEDTSETMPLITDGCKFDRETGTIVITMQLVVNALRLSDKKAIKQLKMK